MPTKQASIVVVRRGKKILLLKRPDCDRSFPGTWCLPGGQADEGESLLATALRELREEAGIVRNRARILGAIQDTSAVNGKTYAITAFIVAQWCRGEIITLSPEHEAWGWFTPETANQLRLAGPVTKHIVATLFAAGRTK